jgi:hypothetical protein
MELRLLPGFVFAFRAFFSFERSTNQACAVEIIPVHRPAYGRATCTVFEQPTRRSDRGKCSVPQGPDSTLTSSQGNIVGDCNNLQCLPWLCIRRTKKGLATSVDIWYCEAPITAKSKLNLHTFPITVEQGQRIVSLSLRVCSML